MNVTPEVCHESAWASVRLASKAQVLALQHYFDRRSLEGNLVALTEAARGHKAQGDPAGSAVYVVLHREALLLTGAYSRRWGTDTERLYAELPGLAMLRQLSQPKTRSRSLLTAAVIVIGAMVLAFAVGLAGAFMRAGYNLLGGGR
jgi:hypothetical protein